MQQKLTALAVLLVTLLVGAALLFGGGGEAGTGSARGTAGKTTANVGEAIMEDGVQYIDIEARGGYTPRTTRAQAGVPTVIRMTTDSTYDCSLALVIRDLEYQNFLPQTGVTEIEVPADKAQGTLRGMCSMAMYHFEVEFEG